MICFHMDGVWIKMNNSVLHNRVMKDRQAQIINCATTNMINPDICWLVDEQPVYNRTQALSMIQHGHSVEFNLYNQQWQRADWSRPVDTPLTELYVQHAIGLRQRYRHLKIAYSGGVDSHTMLQTFRRANISPDEIYYFTFLHQQSYGSNLSTNYEVERGIIDHVSTLQNWFPNTKITMIDFDIDILELLRSMPVDQFPCLTFCGGMRTMSNVTVMSMLGHTDDDTVVLTGCDKPRLDLIDGQWYAYVLDGVSHDVWGKNVQGFYYGADPTIQIAQCHQLKKLFEQIGIKDRATAQKYQASKNFEIRQQINDAIARDRPFDNITVVGKHTTWRSKDRFANSENAILKNYLLYRVLRQTEQGRQICHSWTQMKQQFESLTGLPHTYDVYGKFRNLDTGQTESSQQVIGKIGRD